MYQRQHSLVGKSRIKADKTPELNSDFLLAM